MAAINHNSSERLPVDQAEAHKRWAGADQAVLYLMDSIKSEKGHMFDDRGELIQPDVAKPAVQNNVHDLDAYRLQQTVINSAAAAGVSSRNLEAAEQARLAEESRAAIDEMLGGL
jgi:hypothetical protein